MRLLLVTFAVLIWLTVWSLLDKEPPTLVKPLETATWADLTEKRVLLAIGDSLTAWYQLLPEESFPAQLQKLLDNAWYTILVVNAGKSGDTSSQVRERLEWSLADTQSGDIVLITVGWNDGLQWLPVDQLEDNIRAMVEMSQVRGLQVILGGMQLPPNYGLAYTQAFSALYPQIAEEKNVHLIPFLLTWVAAIPELNLSDGIHPNAAWYTIIAQTIATFLEENHIITKE